MTLKLAAAIVLASLSALTATTATASRPGCPRVYDLTPSKQLAHRIYAGTRTVSDYQLRVMGHREVCQRQAGDGRRLRRYDRRLGRQHDRRVTASQLSSGDLANVPGVPRAFAACVAFRESTDGRLSSDIYGILPMNGYYPGMSVAAQKVLFARMYRQDGVRPWRPWDGC